MSTPTPDAPDQTGNHYVVNCGAAGDGMTGETVAAADLAAALAAIDAANAQNEVTDLKRFNAALKKQQQQQQAADLAAAAAAAKVAKVRARVMKHINDGTASPMEQALAQALGIVPVT